VVTAGPYFQRGELHEASWCAVKDPGRTMHWWYSKADRARIERLSDQIDEAHGRAETAADDRNRAHFLRSAKRLERTRRTRRIYPLRIWLWGASVTAVIMPSAILNPAGDGILGLILVASSWSPSSALGGD
jgi:hypothetical protein